MKIFVAGASGAIGQPLIARLVSQGHTVTGLTQSETGAEKLKKLGAIAEIASVFDVEAVQSALRRSDAEIVIDELTALPKDPAQLAAALPGDRKLRLEGGGNLHRAAQACGVRRYIQQASAFFLKPGDGLADESEGLATQASPNVALGSQAYAELEARTLNAQSMEGVVLRYGFLYGPNTWFYPKGGTGEQVRRQEYPMIGEGQGVWSFVHVDDAAGATVATLTTEPGIYNVVDDDPSPVNRWLPQFATWLGAPAPPRISEEAARQSAGEDAVYYGTKLRGASNKKARRVLNFRPRRLEWLNG